MPDEPDFALTDEPTHVALQQLLLSYERLDSVWRRAYDLDADEKLIVVQLVERAAMSLQTLADQTLLGIDRVVRHVARLQQREFVVVTVVNQSDEGRIVQLTKRGLRARLEFERVSSAMAAFASTPGDRHPPVAEFLQHAAKVAERRAYELTRQD